MRGNVTDITAPFTRLSDRMRGVCVRPDVRTPAWHWPHNALSALSRRGGVHCCASASDAPPLLLLLLLLLPVDDALLS